MSPELKSLVGDTKLTRAQLKVLEVLKDGKRHCRHSLRRLFEEDLPSEFRGSSLKLILPLISSIRKKLPKNTAIVCESWMGGYYYRWIVLLKENSYEKSPNKGRPKKLGNP